MDQERYAMLKLENQLCFPLYACSREIIKRYRPHLDALDLTYTQYIVLMVLWEQGTCSVRDLGRILYLDSGTLTPVLKHLEKKGLVTRKRWDRDERVLMVTLTESGMALRDKAMEIPGKIACSFSLTQEDARTLYRLLNQMLSTAEESEE